MLKNKNQFNNLWIARRRLRLSQKRVARLLGHATTTTLSRYERGQRPPPFVIAVKLAIIYQASVEELFSKLYRELKTEIVKTQTKN